MSALDTANRIYPFVGKTFGIRLMILLVAAIPIGLTGVAMVMAAAGGWFSPVHAAVFGVSWAIAGLGISVGFHRLACHQSYKAKAPVRAILFWMGTLALQGGVASWSATHRRHHSRSDQEGDPHSPLHGFMHAHWGWLYKGNLVHSGPGYDKLMEDKMIRFFEKTQLLWYVSGFMLPGLASFLLGGGFWLGVLWGGVVRVFVVHHVTWSINSICHTFGTRPYTSPDVARNNFVFGVLGFGEGWHNNHHAFPNSAWIGHRWYQVDMGRGLLTVLSWFRLVTDLKIPTKAERLARLKA